MSNKGAGAHQSLVGLHGQSNQLSKKFDEKVGFF